MSELDEGHLAVQGDDASAEVSAVQSTSATTRTRLGKDKQEKLLLQKFKGLATSLGQRSVFVSSIIEGTDVNASQLKAEKDSFAAELQ